MGQSVRVHVDLVTAALCSLVWMCHLSRHLSEQERLVTLPSGLPSRSSTADTGEGYGHMEADGTYGGQLILPQDDMTGGLFHLGFTLKFELICNSINHVRTTTLKGPRIVSDDYVDYLL